MSAAGGSSAEPIARPHAEPVVLDIGGKLGALIVHWNANEIDTPIEISLSGDDDNRQHQHILERPIDGETFHAAVFDKIQQGSYTLWVHDEVRERDVEINGGRITELRWAETATS